MPLSALSGALNEAVPRLRRLLNALLNLHRTDRPIPSVVEFSASLDSYDAAVRAVAGALQMGGLRMTSLPMSSAGGVLLGAWTEVREWIEDHLEWGRMLLALRVPPLYYSDRRIAELIAAIRNALAMLR